MKRRQFIKAVSAGAAVASVPAIVLAETKKHLYSVGDKVSVVGSKHYVCYVGGDVGTVERICEDGAFVDGVNAYMVDFEPSQSAPHGGVYYAPEERLERLNQ